MSGEISINISKVMNWSLTNHNVRLEVAFYTLKTNNYLAHKSAVGYYNSQSLILNTSFRINYHPSEHLVPPSPPRSSARSPTSATRTTRRSSARSRSTSPSSPNANSCSCPSRTTTRSWR